MITRHANEDAVAYGWFMVLAFLVFGALSYFCIMAVYNVVITEANEDIDEGITSEATRAAMAFNRDIALALPVFMLIGVFVWSMVRSIGGSGTTFQVFYFGYVILFVACMVSFLMAFAGGTMMDRMYTALDEKGYIQWPGMSTAWSDAQGRFIITFMNMYYGLCYCVPFLGLAVYFQSIARNTSGSQYLRA